MRIFDPKDQLGNSLLSSADTQKSSVKLEKQMAVGGAITLTSTDISDIENWELSNARVKVDGQMISFLPDTSRDTDGNLVITLGETFSNVVLVLKRIAFDGMRTVTIEMKIQRLMAKTMAAATAPIKRERNEIEANVAEWKALGQESYDTGLAKYENATLGTLEGYLIDGDGVVEVNDCFISVDTLAGPNGWITVSSTVTGVKWHSDLPSYSSTYNSDDLHGIPIVEWTGKIPNVQSTSYMFSGCSNLTSWTVELPNSLTSAYSMFQDCTGLTSWNVELPNSLTDAAGMFSDCTGLTSFSTPSGALPDSLTDASSMFSGCTSLTSWTVELPDSLTNAGSMFSDCTGLTSFSTPSGNLPNNLTNAGSMFSGCSKLESFTVSMPASLKSNARYMFYGCKLNLASVKKISETIAQISDTQTFTLGIAKSLQNNAEVQGYLQDIRNKGWTVEVKYNA